MNNNSKRSPNYLLTFVVAIVVAAVCGGAAFALKKPTAVVGIAAIAGFLVSMLALVFRSAVDDSKKAVVESAATKEMSAAMSAIALERYDKAEKDLKKVLESTQSLDKGHPLRLNALSALATLYLAQKKHSQSKDMLVQRLSAYEANSEATADSIDPLLDLIDCEVGLKSYDEALTQLKRALPFLEKKEDQALVRALNLQIDALQAKGSLKDSVPVLLRIRTYQQKFHSENDIRVIQTSLKLARTYRQEKMLNEAFENYKDVLVRLNKSEQSFRILEVECLLEMAEVCLDLGQVKNTEPIAISALKVMQQYVGPNQRLLADLFRIYHSSLEKQGVAPQPDDLFHLFSKDEDTVRDQLKGNPNLLQVKDKSGWTALHWCCFLKRDDLFKWMLRNGSKVESTDPAVMAPIHVAAAWHKMSGVSAMIEAGAAVDQIGPNGWTALLYAASLGKQDTVEQLLVAGANVNQKDAQGRTALHLAAQGGFADVCLVLISKGADKNLAETKYGRTALHLAAQYGRGSVVNSLINNQADLNLKDSGGKTATDLAEAAGHKLLVQALRYQETLSKAV